MKKVSKVLTATISCLMATTLVMPICAEDKVEKKESVYTVLNSDGSVNTITVSDTLHSDSGFSNYQDKSDLQNVENLKSSDAVNSSNGNLIWNTSDKDIYYQGTSNKELPLTVKITYVLDGKELTSDELVGKSGHLEISVKVTNSSKQSYKANGKTYNLVTPFVTGLVCMMDDDIFTNVKVNSGTVTSDSSHSLITSVMVPGLKSGLKQVLDTDLMHKLEDYLIDEITIEADVTDYESPTLMMAAATSTDALKEEFDDVDDFSSIFDKLDDLKEATNELIDGTSDLYDGAVKLNDGVATLKDGASKLSSGSKTLADGIVSASSGASTINSGLGQLTQSNESLVNGVNSATDAILKAANETLDANESIKNDEDYEKLTWANFSDQIDTYTGVTKTMRDAAFNQIKQQVANAGVTIDDDNLKMVIYMAAKDNRSDLATYLSEKQSSLTTAANVQQAKTDAAKIKSGDFSKVDRALTLATYEGAIKTVQSAVYNATVSKDDEGNIAQEGTLLTTRQAEAVLIQAAQNRIDISSATKEQICNIVTSVLQSIGKDDAALGVDNESIKSIIGSLRQSQTDARVYSSLSNTLKADPYKLDDDTIALLLTEGSEQHSTATSISAMISAVQSDVTIAQEISANKEASKSETGVQVVNSYLSSLVKTEKKDEFTSLNELKTNLTSLATLRTGIVTYTSSVKALYDGSNDLVSGLKSLTDGSKTLYDGAASLSQGVNTLKDGSQQLADGAKTLKDGMVKYNDEAISKLTDSSRITSLEEASNLLEAISNSEDNYSNYSGISDDAEGSIKFVFKVNGSKKAKSDDASSETTKEKVSFWQRIKNLFKF